MRSLSVSPCSPPWWARGGHAQTLLGHFLPSPRLKEHGQTVTIPLADGDHLVATHFPGNSGLVVSLFHGLTGHAGVDYMARTARLCRRAGHSVYLVNHRGCGAGERLARRPYHSGRGEDISDVVAFARRHEPGRKQLAIGFSLSGNALLCLVTGIRGTEPPDFAISVNAPIDLAACADRLAKRSNRLYDFRFVSRLRRMIRRREELGLADKSYTLARGTTLREFDSIFTAPESGFASREHYYDQCSTYARLDRIRIPCWLLTSEDDPFVPVDAYLSAKLSPSTRLHVERHGGHMGYLTSRPTPLGNSRWLDYAIDEIVREIALQSS